jgi:HSP20 family molecular chaperone IbpA
MTDLGDLGGSVVRSAMERVGRGVSKVQERKPLPYDLLESEEDYLVVFDAPGAEHSDVQVRFVDGEVQVRVDRFREFHEEFEMRFPGRGLALSGRAQLPADAVDAADATATLTDAGTLQVRVPKAEDSTDVPVAEEESSENPADAESEDDPAADDA